MERVCLDLGLNQRCVERVLESECFGRSPQARRFLQFVTRQEQGALALKAYTIGVHALGVQSERSCPETTARMQASRVRRLLLKFYQTEGRAERVVLQLPSGSYEPRFVYRTTSEASPSQQPRLYVEDFESLSSSTEDEGFCRGLTDAIVGWLVQCPHLKVVRSRAPASLFGGFVLTGSVTQIADQLRVSVQCCDGETRETLWSEHFDQSLTGHTIIQLQDALALRTACRVGDPTAGVLARHLRSRLVLDAAGQAMDAFRHFLKAPSLTSLSTARTALEGCLPHASGTAMVHAAYACVLCMGAIIGESTSKNQVITAETHARLCISQDATSALGHLARALIHYERRETAGVMRELLRTTELCGVDVGTRALCGLIYCLVGDFTAGLAQLRAARQQSPDLPSYLLTGEYLHHFYERGDFKKSLEFAQQIDVDGGVFGDVLLAASYGRLGQLAEARRVTARIVAEHPNAPRLLAKYLNLMLYVPEVAGALTAALSEVGVVIAHKARVDRAVYRVLGSRRELPSEIRVGVLQSLSGTMALSETHLVNAAMLAIEEINHQGGVLGRPVRGVVEDGASEASIFCAKAERLLVEQNVSSIFGCWTSSSRKAVVPMMEAHNALLWYPLQYEGLETSRNVVYTGSCLNQQIEPAVRWAQRQGKLSCYLVGSDYVFPRTANRLIRALAEASGGQVLGSAYQPLGSARFDAIASEIARLKPDIVYNTVNGSDNVLLFDALARAGVDVRRTVVMSFSLSELELGRCVDTAHGHLACWSYFQSMDSPRNRALLARFRGRYGESEVLSDPAVTAYSQVHLWKDVVERAGALGTEAVLAQLEGSKMVLGDDELEVLSNHHVQRRAVIGQASGSQFKVIWASPGPIAPQPWLGVDTTDFLGRDLVLGALKALPEMAAQHSAREA